MGVYLGEGDGWPWVGCLTALSLLMQPGITATRSLSPSSCSKWQIVRALEHLHSKLSVIHRGQCPGRPGEGPGCSHTRSCPVLLGPHRRGPEAAGPDVPVGSGAEPVARSRPLSTPPSHFPQPPGPVPVPLAGAPSTDGVDRCPGKAEPSCFDVLCVARHAGGLCTTA